MAVKLVLLKSGENIIADVKEGFLEDKLVCYLLEKPCRVDINGSYKIIDDDSVGNKVSVSLKPWPALSKQTTVEIVTDWIITIVDPNDEIQKMYKTQVLEPGENENDQSISVDEQSDSNQSD